ncbi:hypothetical protein ACTXT7_010927 [Hymenolepis weldensis]
MPGRIRVSNAEEIENSRSMKRNIKELKLKIPKLLLNVLILNSLDKEKDISFDTALFSCCFFLETADIVSPFSAIFAVTFHFYKVGQWSLVSRLSVSAMFNDQLWWWWRSLDDVAKTRLSDWRNFSIVDTIKGNMKNHSVQIDNVLELPKKSH